ncbi:MAG: SIS domain-containing protein [Bacteroidales bacterium]
MDNTGIIRKLINSRTAALNLLLSTPGIVEAIDEVAGLVTSCYLGGGKVLFCGNGGSAADAQHLAAELSGRFYLNRKPLPALALHVNTSHLTAVANDISFDEVYARLVEAHGQKGDILVALSTSGNLKTY